MATYYKKCLNYNSSWNCQQWEFSGDLFYWNFNAEQIQTQSIKYKWLSKDKIEGIYNYEFVLIFSVFIFFFVIKIFRILSD